MGTAGRDVFERGEQHHRSAAEQCRICACDVAEKERIDIFAEDARRKYLQTKIRKYLYILVSNEDKLPKMVCSTCVKRLEGVHRFATMAYRTQEKLRLQFDQDNDLSDDLDDNKEIEVDNGGKKHFIGGYEKQQQKDRGLLHSILTKGGIEILTDKEPMTTEAEDALGLSEVDVVRDDSQSSVSNMEEMEVKVDPMIFLECDLEDGTLDYSDTSQSNDEKFKEIETSEEMTGSHGEKHADIEALDDGRGTNKDSSEDGKGNESEDDDVSNTALKPYKCTICARSFVSQIGLQNHLWSHLPRERRYGEGKPILRSQHVYSTNGVLHTHTGENAVSTGNFVCPICSKRISTKGNLKVHLETHRPKGKYGCDICGRIFKTQSNLFRHKEYHSGIQFPCNVCGRVYPTNSTLRAHSITHSNLRPHACPLCVKTFKRNQDLKFHINQHTGARPYQCPYCPKAFASSGNCFSHRKRMHPREVHRDRQRAADLMR